MAEAMGVNRTVMSNFINQTYGKNFNCYLNLWRIEGVPDSNGTSFERT